VPKTLKALLPAFAAILLLIGVTQARAQDAALLKKGEYLARAGDCIACHTAREGKTFAGGLPMKTPFGTLYTSNITPDPQTGIGKWTNAQIKVAIRRGKRPDGTLLGPPMPFGQYRGIADSDIDAVVAYLRTVPAVNNAVAKSTYNIPLPPAWGPPIDKPVVAPSASDKVAYGAYLAGPLGHCVECHTPMGPDHR